MCPEISRQVFSMMEATDWSFLPYAGGLLDQPDWLMADLFTLSHEKAAIKKAQEDQNGTTN